MKLIQVEAHGFKSFADKVTLKFDGGVAAIIGPNGSGKSNINDAIKWVLGETSSKALRGDSMEDIIFAGSKTEQPMDRAEVILTFDNKDREVSIPHDYFTISRVLTRGKGANEYYINGEEARAKDIKEIAMMSGISKSSLAIISQGTISGIAEATPEQRRDIFEEASGTSMYRSRKIEVQRKLERTEESLGRATVLLNELERQLGPLRRQAEKAKTYLEYKEQLKDIEVSLLVHDQINYAERLKDLTSEVNEYEITNQDITSRIKALTTSAEIKTEAMNESNKMVQELNAKIDKIKTEIQSIEIRSAAVEKQRSLVLSGQIKATTEAKIESLKEILSELNEKIVSFKKYISDKTALINELNEKSITFSTQTSKLNSMLGEKHDKLSKVRSKIEVILEAQESKTNISKGTKNIVENAHLFKGYKALVSQIINVEPQYAIAIETVLANAVQHIVVDNSDTAVKAIEFLKQNNGGRATFIPLSSINPKFINEQHIVVAQTQKGFLGVASELVQVDKEFTVLKRFLLGNILVSDNIENANKLSQLLEKKYMVVTLEGDIIRPGGVMVGGQAQHTTSTFGLEEQVKKLQEIVPLLEEEIEKIRVAKAKIEHDQKEVINLTSNYTLEKSNFESLLKEAQTKFDDYMIQYTQLSDEKIELESNIDFASSINKLITDKSNLEANLRTQQNIYQETSNSYYEIIRQKSDLEAQAREILSNSKLKYAEKATCEAKVEEAKRRLAEEYNMILETAMQYYNPDADVSGARVLVNQIRQEIRQLGHVNVDAIQELEEVQNKYNDHKKQTDDIIKAKEIFEQAIAEMDKIIVQRITETVNLVNNEFRFVFQKMFGGGMAEIRYTDPENILETGIDVIAQPPGKSVKNLKLFSGGEKALIAISLLFSILKAKPLPLCILDEVEAALDEANVIRFAQFLQSLKKDTQFIVITHRQGTMERVDKLYGATMQKRGVTTFFSVNLADAKKLIEN
ncbi:chromosome segregation protein [Metamycoplasma subdolum]|uniref:Chromosome partition protein Smc n=1 Tax=Metamycoplasma subdolum TaxID=92407 RepID=A0A3M0A4U3_9BACT|nr:AAA family ATPase [Metamycoplasma subdolum]RMA78519.1 chromosome segregation protein [Metamycoplasma subdolum]WPB50451.1 AAA family ATPase [Metamycoplasma subdolum]